MSESLALQALVKRVINGQITSTDLETLRKWLSGSLDSTSIQFGKYNINIAQGQDIQIGDRIYQGADAVAIRQTVLSLLEARQFRTLLTHAEFSDRIEQSALASYRVPLVGRDASLQKIQRALGGDNQVIVLHGSAGLGKTRLLLALANVTGNEQTLWACNQDTCKTVPRNAETFTEITLERSQLAS
jgi:hypothetical protein